MIIEDWKVRQNKIVEDQKESQNKIVEVRKVSNEIKSLRSVLQDIWSLSLVKMSTLKQNSQKMEGFCTKLYF